MRSAVIKYQKNYSLCTSALGLVSGITYIIIEDILWGFYVSADQMLCGFVQYKWWIGWRRLWVENENLNYWGASYPISKRKKETSSRPKCYMTEWIKAFWSQSKKKTRCFAHGCYIQVDMNWMSICNPTYFLIE